MIENHYLIHMANNQEISAKRKYYNTRLRSIYSGWNNNENDNKIFIASLLDLIIYHIKIWIIPKYFLKAIKYKIAYLFSLFQYIFWGYGEKPSRIILVILFIITTYTNIYYKFGPIDTKNNIINSIYFSVVTFTTLGYGDIKPHTNFMKMVCSSEAILGAILLGLIIAGFSNKSRYWIW